MESKGTTRRSILPPTDVSPRRAACLQARGFELQGAELASIQGSSDASLTQPEAETTEESLEAKAVSNPPTPQKKTRGGVPDGPKWRFSIAVVIYTGCGCFV